MTGAVLPLVFVIGVFGFVLIARAMLLRHGREVTTTTRDVKIGLFIVSATAVLVVGVVFGGAIVEALADPGLTPR